MRDERLGIAIPLPLPGSRKRCIYPVLIVPLLGIVRDEQGNKQLLFIRPSKFRKPFQVIQIQEEEKADSFNIRCLLHVSWA